MRLNGRIKHTIKIFCLANGYSCEFDESEEMCRIYVRGRLDDENYMYDSMATYTFLNDDGGLSHFLDSTRQSMTKKLVGEARRRI